MLKSVLSPDLIDWPGLVSAHNGGSLLYQDVSFNDAALLLKGRLTYLATPYSKEVKSWTGDWCSQRSRAMGDQAASWSARCAAQNLTVISPIILSVDMVENDDTGHLDPMDGEFWWRWDKPILDACQAVLVPAIHGWSRSVGVWSEVLYALERNKSVYITSATPIEKSA